MLIAYHTSKFYCMSIRTINVNINPCNNSPHTGGPDMGPTVKLYKTGLDIRTNKSPDNNDTSHLSLDEYAKAIVDRSINNLSHFLGCDNKYLLSHICMKLIFHLV